MKKIAIAVACHNKTKIFSINTYKIEMKSEKDVIQLLIQNIILIIKILKYSIHNKN